MACRLAGMPLPQRAPVSSKRPAEGEAGSDGKADAMNGPFSSNKKPRVNLDGSQPAPARPHAPLPTKRLAAAQLKADSVKKAVLNSDLASKQARVEDAPESDENEPPAQVESYTWRKRVASEEPDTLRQEADRHTKRAKLDTTTAE